MTGGRQRTSSREQILKAATHEFARKGLDGARVDVIAKRSRVNKTMIYHYFKSKEGLFIAVLEVVYETVRARQQDLNIRGMEPEEGMRHLVEFTADVWIEFPEFTRLLGSENIHEARHVKKSKKIIEMYNPLVDTIRELLVRGEERGVFCRGVDPIDLYISITSLSAYYVAHRYTFEAVFQTQLMTPDRIAQRKKVICETILRYLRADAVECEVRCA
jgi:TetR/AcrR family transcriptional regulator